MVGLSGLEPPTSRLSGVRSNQLSYRPIYLIIYSLKTEQATIKRLLSKKTTFRTEWTTSTQDSLERRGSSRTFRYGYLVTTSPQPLVPPSAAAPREGSVTDFGCCRLSWCDGRCVQGPGTYSPRHADPRLLAIPASCRRVAAYNPNGEWFYGIGSSLRFRCPLFHPL